MDRLEINRKLADQAKVILLDIEETRRILSSASNWGVADIFLDSGIISWIKQSKIRKAEGKMKLIHERLNNFKLELEKLDIDVREISVFESFIDIFFDNLFIDIFIQSKISGKISDLDKLEEKLKDILGGLGIND